MDKQVAKPSSLAEAVMDYVTSCGIDSVNLHQKVFQQIEPLLLKTVMEWSHYNKSHAARALGLSRGTVSGLLVNYFDAQYCSRKSKQR